MKSEKSDKSITQHWKCKKPTERTMAIMERAMQKRGITKRALDIDGQRHFMLVNLLSSGVTRLLTREELMGAIKIITPRYAKEEDCWQLVADWYQNYRNDNKPVSQDMAWTFADVLNPVNKEEKHELDDVDDEAYPGDVSGGRCGCRWKGWRGCNDLCRRDTRYRRSRWKT
jgi:hypothetical protein